MYTTEEHVRAAKAEALLKHEELRQHGEFLRQEARKLSEMYLTHAATLAKRPESFVLSLPVLQDVLRADTEQFLALINNIKGNQADIQEARRKCTDLGVAVRD